MNFYIIFRRSDGVYVKSLGISNGGFISRGFYGSNVCIDVVLCWNCINDVILVLGIVDNSIR